jgi:hypothetical protein
VVFTLVTSNPALDERVNGYNAKQTNAYYHRQKDVEVPSVVANLELEE